MDFWTTVAANALGGLVGGVAAGLIVACALWLINHLKTPRFQYVDIGNNRAEFHYNRYRPIIIGGSFELGHGPAMIGVDRRAGHGGFYFGPKAAQVFWSSQSPQLYGLEVGSTITIAYCYAPLRIVLRKRSRWESTNYEISPLDVMNSQFPKETTNIQKRREIAEEDRMLKRWKLANVTLQPSQTLQYR